MGVVRDDSFGTADYECVVRRRKLDVVVVDMAVPMLSASAFDEAFRGFDRTDGTDGREN